jgi:transposase InsO family protein
MNEQQLREEAIRRYKNGKSPKEIYQELGKSKRWFFKWLKRYQCDGNNWSESQSRRPHRLNKKVDDTMEQTVIETRKNLEKELYAQIGALNISWHLNQQGITPPPISTINNILKRHNLIRKRLKYQPKGVDYPAPAVTRSNDLHQLDTVGPRYLKEDGRFYSTNIIDAYDRRCNINPMRRKSKIDIANSLIRCWQTLGIPGYLQMDNTLATQGSHLHPHSFGVVVRLCLRLGIQPIFIPIKEPWRNGIIERFQDVFDKMFFRAQFFPTFKHVVEQAKGFESFHNKNHRYSTLDGKTPREKFSGDAQLLSKNFLLPKRLAIEPGHIHLIRFIRSNLILDIFSEKFPLSREAEYEYVWATIDIAKQKLFVSHDSKLIAEFNYALPKTSMDLSKIEL